MYGMTRGTATLVGVAVAGLMLWLATQFNADENAEYWAQVGLVAAAGLTMALSQLLGGWTKWGWPRLTAGVFLLGFLPALVVGGLVLLHAQPDSGAFGAGWASDLGLGDVADDLAGVVLAIAFGLGLTFGLTFDTTGPRVAPVDEAYEEDVRAQRGYAGPMPAHASATADEPTTAERGAVGNGQVERDRVHEADRERDRDSDRERDRDGEETYAGSAPSGERPRRGFFRR